MKERHQFGLKNVLVFMLATAVVSCILTFVFRSGLVFDEEFHTLLLYVGERIIYLMCLVSLVLIWNMRHRTRSFASRPGHIFVLLESSVFALAHLTIGIVYLIDSPRLSSLYLLNMSWVWLIFRGMLYLRSGAACRFGVVWKSFFWGYGGLIILYGLFRLLSSITHITNAVYVVAYIEVFGPPLVGLAALSLLVLFWPESGSGTWHKIGVGLFGAYQLAGGIVY